MVGSSKVIDILTKTFNNLPIGVGIFKINDLNSINDIEYVYMNKVILYEMRKELDEVLGKKIMEVAPEAYEHEGGKFVMETYRRIAQEGGSVNLGLVEYSNHMVAGTYECSIHHIEDNYVYVMLKNVTELEKTKNELEKSNKELLLRNKEVQEFVYIASHDIQEPLRSITSMIEAFSEDYQDKLDEEAIEYCKIIKDRTNRLRSIVSGILNYSKIGQDTEKEEIDTNLLLKEVIEDLSNIIERKNASITISDLPNIIGSKNEIRMLFLNLIGNAIKFSRSEADPVVEVGIDEKSYFFIRDNGIGIKEEDKESIFKIFKRLNNKSAYEGSGIGLAHCFKIVNKYEGAITVESKFGEGSTFRFNLK